MNIPRVRAEKGETKEISINAQSEKIQKVFSLFFTFKIMVNSSLKVKIVVKEFLYYRMRRPGGELL